MIMRARQHQLSAIRWFLAAFLAAIVLTPLQAQAWWNGDWSYRSKITIAAGQAPAGRMPLLVRLHEGNFKFTDAKDDGSDIRFVDGDDKTPLKFHIESYDNLLGMALVWVDAPAAPAGTPTEIWLYYGNANAPVGADARGTYDPDTTLVYHFADRNAPPRDQTANGNNATDAAKSTDTALIGRGAHFDGSVMIKLPASPSLVMQAGDAMTWSAWIKPDGIGPAFIFARHEGGNGLVIGLDQGKPYVVVATNGAEQRDGATQALAPGAWHHIAVVASTQIILYVDGKAAATLAARLPAMNTPAVIGGDITSPQPANYAGDMDELEISKVARSAEFIAAAAASQGPDSKLLMYGEGEENAGMSGGYFGVILRSVTIDGWVVIAILAVMAVVSFGVMYDRTRYIGRVARANRKFLAIFEQAGTDIMLLQSKLGESNTGGLGESVLFRITEGGMEELARRSPQRGMLALSSQSIDTIRAKLDRITSRETQRLNSMMVLLTIAISGGPFLGLLGTVVGVMITFAAIAASGDVNINAIAPGIAAALVATVAGLAVAIPALFGYNYLITRIKEMTTEMHVFTDEFVTRVAEAYPPRGQHPSLAAE
jgi:biopolymer transport protein ExbB